MSQVIPFPGRPQYRAPMYEVRNRHQNGFTLHRQGAATKIVLDGQNMRWATAEWISDDFLARMKSWRDQELKAPRGDSTACWQKIAEVPLGYLLSKVPVLEDERYVAKFLNDPDYRKLRCDGNHRRL